MPKSADARRNGLRRPNVEPLSQLFLEQLGQLLCSRRNHSLDYSFGAQGEPTRVSIGLIKIPLEQSVIGVNAAVTEERPMGARGVDGGQVALDDQRLLRVV